MNDDNQHQKRLVTITVDAPYCPHCLSVSIRGNGTTRHEQTFERYYLCLSCAASFRALFAFPDKRLLQQAE